jgi:hypothetical protein
MTLEFSRRLAIVIGVLTPIAETIRRWHQLGDVHLLPFWLDDYLLGAFLLYGAWRTGRDVRSGRPVLAAAWSFTCGMAYCAFFSQLSNMSQPDPGPLSSEWVVAIKGVGLVLATAALVASLKSGPE